MGFLADPWAIWRGAARNGVAFALLCLGAWNAQAAQPITIGCVEFPPLSYTDSTGKPAGKAMDLVTSILDKAGLPWEAKCYPGARLLTSLRDGSVQVAMMIRHPELTNTALYGHVPVAFLDLEAYRLASHPPLGSMNNARGKSIILLRGYGYGGWIEFFKDPANNIHVSYADTRQAAFKMLSSGHGDYLVDYRDPAMLALGENTVPRLRHELLTRLETYFLVSKQAPDAGILLRRIEDGFKQMGGKPIN